MSGVIDLRSRSGSSSYSRPDHPSLPSTVAVRDGYVMTPPLESLRSDASTRPVWMPRDRFTVFIPEAWL